ncbi:MAG TPA: hypothetical protein VLH08_16460 [Acidobacteriota bacterium]|nr:hypothetical protein [Acidobacteriota bacterium]
MLKIVAIGIAGMMMFSCMVGFYAIQSGIAIIDVRDKVSGKHVFVPVPVGLVNASVNMLPGHVLNQVRGNLGTHHKIVRQLSIELEKIPDTNFVEIQKGDEHVLVSKNGRNLVIDVDTPEQSIYVRVPIRSTSDLLAKVAAAAENEY